MDDLASVSVRATAMVDSDHPDVIAMAKAAVAGATKPLERAVKLYYAVRDGIRYDPYRWTAIRPHLHSTWSCATR